ncbi:MULTISPECIES: class I SAM-dependent methyltransferase [unclassified Paenibacillus]|uniref:class I SAM-dependent methyltransferase n=1 Tax=unclassified Paenibacillus TaxID=185978 RepID=UPI000419C560|nr:MULTISPECIES: class I SAM-dependent methyltransferase [unclassified Paenibacillus]KGP80871.1 SAM-dependent methyltransferase [Paenibacillus sp. MAEPY2]KGP88028.1 SAM-dependent methyltransferase [Paenibacillus sp. MAEPY1]
MSIENCRCCGAALNTVFLDLGISPLANSYVKSENQMENMYPLRTYVCEVCFLVQVQEYESPEHIFSDYAYFSSYSDTWLNHSKNYVQHMMDKFHYTNETQVVEIASNDGYLLQYFKEKGVAVLGIEPAENVAKVAVSKGIETSVNFFGTSVAKELKKEGKVADLLLGNNVLAHVPDLNDFVAGMNILLKPQGTITMEFPHLLQLIEHNQFDTIYHEHYSYFSLTTVIRLFKQHHLTVYDVEQLSTHGGSIRIYATHSENPDLLIQPSVHELLAKEDELGMTNIEMYRGFQARIVQLKRRITKFLIELKDEGKIIAGYGAPAKGNTLINYCGIDCDIIDFTVDRSTYKQGTFLPGSRIPVYSPEKLKLTQPDYVFILPWNLKDEIMEQTSFIHEWGGKWILPIPDIHIVE